MNRDSFFTTAKLTRTPIEVKQEGENGYSLSMVLKYEGEEPQHFTLMYKNEPRYFKSLSGVESTLREQNIFNFSVVMEKQEVKKSKRMPKEVSKEVSKEISIEKPKVKAKAEDKTTA